MIEIFIYIIPAMGIGFVIQIMGHELGHFLGGSLNGWHLIYLQIFHLVIAKEEKCYKLKTVSTRAFQCIMYPDSLKRGAVLYTLGGCMLNLVIALIGFIGMIAQHDNPVLWIYAWCFFVFGMVLFFINIIPSTKRICNDGACYLLLKSDQKILQCHNAQLMTARYLSMGFTYNQISQDIICFAIKLADNDILAYQAVLEYYYWMDMKQYDLMRQAINKIDINASISPNILHIVCMEKLSMELLQIITDNNSKLIDMERVIGNIPEYIKAHETSGDVQSLRVIAVYDAYENLQAGNREQARFLIDEAIQHIHNMKCIYSGEKIFCINQLKKVKVLCM